MWNNRGFLMNYSEAREYVSKNQSIVLGLDNIRRLCALLGNPQNSLKIIHIAGTNGKGSAGAFIEAILRDAGLRVGRFSSPAVFEYREQWTINGENITEEKYAAYIGKIRLASEGKCAPTPFELETALAFLYFCEEKCDIVVVEVGMGGAEDATNVISKSLVSVITPIALDHAAYLGSSIEEIAAAKAGIIKENGAVVTAPQAEEVMAVLKKTAAQKHASLTIAKNSTDYEISLRGAYQRENAALALEVCRHIDGVSGENIKNGLKNAVWRGRFEKICSNPELILDGAHNPHGARALADSIDLYFKDRRIIYITGVFADKDYEKIAKITAPKADKIYTVTPPSARGLENTKLAEAFGRFNPNVEALTLDTALKLCLNEEDAVIIAFGSLSFLGDLKRRAEDIIRMRKCSKILKNAEFRGLLAKINEAEKNRIYCLHGIEHLMDVARAGYIINLENRLNIPKEIVYGAALMHDIGRWAQYEGTMEHHIASAEAAERILPQCGYTREETALISDAVRAHRNTSEKIETLSDVIAEADQKTRMCMLCSASDTCKWKEIEKNNDLII